MCNKNNPMWRFTHDVPTPWSKMHITMFPLSRCPSLAGRRSSGADGPMLAKTGILLHPTFILMVHAKPASDLPLWSSVAIRQFILKELVESNHLLKTFSKAALAIPENSQLVSCDQECLTYVFRGSELLKENISHWGNFRAKHYFP